MTSNPFILYILGVALYIGLVITLSNPFILYILGFILCIGLVATLSYQNGNYDVLNISLFAPGFFNNEVSITINDLAIGYNILEDNIQFTSANQIIKYTKMLLVGVCIALSAFVIYLILDYLNKNNIITQLLMFVLLTLSIILCLVSASVLLYYYRILKSDIDKYIASIDPSTYPNVQISANENINLIITLNYFASITSIIMCCIIIPYLLNLIINLPSDFDKNNHSHTYSKKQHKKT